MNRAGTPGNRSPVVRHSARDAGVRFFFRISMMSTIVHDVRADRSASGGDWASFEWPSSRTARSWTALLMNVMSCDQRVVIVTGGRAPVATWVEGRMGAVMVRGLFRSVPAPRSPTRSSCRRSCARGRSRAGR